MLCQIVLCVDFQAFPRYPECDPPGYELCLSDYPACVQPALPVHLDSVLPACP